MRLSRPRLRLVAPAVMTLALAALGGCSLNFSNQAEAHDQWKRSYTLTQSGTLEIRNTNGRMNIEPGDGNALEVTAVRTVHAATDEAAKDGLAKFDIAEGVAPDHVTLDSSNRGAGLFIGLSRQVDYDVRVPRSANVTLNATNGDITITGIVGVVKIETTNGRIRASGLENNVKVESTNGAISLDFAKLGPDGITGETTNGMITVTVPRDTKAQISARVTNGAITTDGLTLAVSEQSRRRLDGTIGGGGPNIRLETTNGAIAVKGK